MKLLAIVNPIAGSGRVRKLWPRIERLLRQAGHAVQALLTRHPGDAETLAYEATARSFDRMLVAGGDGTLHEVTNGLVRAGTPLPEVGLLPLGTGRDVARALRFPRKLSEMVQAALSPLVRRLDLMALHLRTEAGNLERVCVNVGGFGFDAQVAHRANRYYRKLGRRTFAIYLVSVLQELSRLPHFRIRGEVDGEPFEAHTPLVVFASGQYFGGGFFVAPHARMDDGTFELVWTEPLSRWEIIRLLPSLYRGTHLTHPRVHTRTFQHARFDSVPRAVVEADGEIVGFTSVEVHPHPLKLPVSAPET